MNNQKAYHAQTAEFIATVIRSMPQVPVEIMQGWLENSRALNKVLTEALCPPSDNGIMSEEIMEGWINNTKALQKVLKEELCPPDDLK